MMFNRLFKLKRKEKNEFYRIFYEMFYDRVYQTAYFITRDEYLAQDVVQETFLKAFRRLDDLEDGAKAGAWLNTIASRSAIDMLRKRKKWNGTPLEDVLLETEQKKCSFPNPTEQEAEFIWMKEQVVKEMSALKPEYRQVLLLKYEQGLQDEEIADVLQEKVGTVKSRIHRARKQLKSVVIHDLNA